MNIKGTKSEENLRQAFAGESQARNKYTYYMQMASDEGLEELAKFYRRMAENEMVHARLWFELLHDGLDTVEDTLLDSSAGEGYEWTSMYPSFAQVARDEGLEELAELFEMVASVERDHERMFLEELIELKSGRRSTAATARQSAKKCVFCGYIHLDAYGEAPYVCPLCGALGSYEDTIV